MKHTSSVTREEKLAQLAAMHPIYRQYHLDVQEMVDEDHPNERQCPSDTCGYSDVAHDLYRQLCVVTDRANTNNSPRAQRQREVADRIAMAYETVVSLAGKQAADDLVLWARRTRP